MYYRPPHEVRDHEKLATMIETLKNGGELPPVLVCGEYAYSGSHRLVAWEVMGMEPSTVEISEEEYCIVMTALGLDAMYDDARDLEEFMDIAREMGFAGEAQ